MGGPDRALGRDLGRNHVPGWIPMAGFHSEPSAAEETRDGAAFE
jgi:hypothetical protein